MKYSVICLALIAGAAQAQTSAVFDRACVACHQAGGKGMPGMAPALAGPLAPILAKPEGKRYLSGVLLNGLSGKIVSDGNTFMGAMASQAAMSDAELAEVANYITKDLNGAATSFTAEDFATARAAKIPHKELRELRERLLK
ncbi:cytochrome c [Pelomonas sp. KK5]|uniref:c-type cytochrome n=1 Tax=Pelomonas sp. KK5 TaxID=1855730 RepID=UPI00097C4B0D|nr:cytochrome c [Pelomonas sp. KK5]